MFEKVKENLEQVIEISNKCPEPYRIECFRVLLEAIVSSEPEKAHAYAEVDTKNKEKPLFFNQYPISDEKWQRVFNYDGKTYDIIVKDLKEKTTSKKQIKLSLLLGVKSQLESNEPYISKDALVDMCKKYSCYDSANFSGYMKKNKDLFIEKASGWNLSIPGLQKAAEVIEELA
jgi:hypothetical protein